MGMRPRSLKRLIQACLRQWPEMTRAQAEERARVVRHELDRLDRNELNNELRYYRHNVWYDPQSEFGDGDPNLEDSF